jgi:alpha-ketoglutarate-dependent taurine dioxygenase
LGEKFGELWDTEQYHRGSVKDPTLNEDEDNPVSYFTTNNNRWNANLMKYHADMAHVGERSFPARALYMVRTADDRSGKTYWLNLEHAWSQFTAEEQAHYDGVTVTQHFMYEPGTRLETFPFLKTNPNSGRVSPRVNCYGTTKTWIHHVSDRDGQEIRPFGEFMEGVYKLCESKQDTLYCHDWDNGDLLIYDNWFSVHRRDPVNLAPGEPARLLKRLSFNI